MLRTNEGKYIFSEKNIPICDCTRSNQMPLTDHNRYCSLRVHQLPLSYHLIVIFNRFYTKSRLYRIILSIFLCIFALLSD